MSQEQYVNKTISVCIFSLTLPLSQVLVLVLKVRAEAFAPRPRSLQRRLHCSQ